MKSLLLDRSTWDLSLDANGNLAVCTEPYAVLQDVACAIRVFAGECWYDTSKGLPYLTAILGRGQTASAFKTQAEAAALTVPLVSTATCVVNRVGVDRKLTGAIQITLTTGETLSVGLS